MTLPVASDADQKNGGHAEAPRQGKSDMLSVAEKATKASLLQKVGTEYIQQSPEKRAAVWLEDNIQKSQTKILTLVTDLTPALATVLLDRNADNRKINHTLVGSYSRDMENGAWHLNGEPLIIAKNGMMNDGQHRCFAVIDAGVAVPAVFVFGVDRETRTTVDQGKVRTVADYLSMNGQVNTNALAAAGVNIWQHLHFGLLSNSGRNRPTKGEVLSLIEEHPNIIKSLGKVSVAGAHAVGGISMLTFCHWVFARHDEIAADAFMTALTGGAGLFDRNPILYARNRLISERGRLRPNDRAEMIFRAWNAMRRGDNLIRSFPILGGKLPDVEA